MTGVKNLIKEEEQRQRETLMLIPSENYASKDVRNAVGSVLMNKYAEGQPGRRYYQGNNIADEVERTCEENALKAFGLSSQKWSANVQPHSGCEANLAVYNSVLSLGDKIMSMNLLDGGHLSHGWQYMGRKLTLVSKIYNVEFYRVEKDTKVFDYDKIEKQAQKFNPKMIISGGTAYPREIDYKRMSLIAKKVGAYYLADVSHEAGLISAGVCKSPFPYADFVTMTTHKTLRGPRGAMIISKKKYEKDVDFSIIPGIQGGPHLHSIAGISTALNETMSKEFKKYAEQIVKNSRILANELIKKGFDVVSGGTDKHLVLIDLRNKKTNGWFVAWALEEAGIIANRNTVPYDTGSPYYPSGLRIGSQAVTTRGMKEFEMVKIARWISDVVDHIGQRTIPEENRSQILNEFKNSIKKDVFLKKISTEVKTLCRKYPCP